MNGGANRVAVRRCRQVAAKRVVDTAVVAVTAPVTVPLLLLTALAVRVGMGRQVLFRQERVGLDEQPFELLKFRSMKPDRSPDGSELSPAQRLTGFGRWLRKSSLDELPQLLNVLRGEMSLVGPRPLLVSYLPYYTERERLRHSVRPGITGAAQTAGRNALGWDERLALDSEYAQNVSLCLDVAILMRTAKQVIFGRDVIADLPETGVFLYDQRSGNGQ